MLYLLLEVRGKINDKIVPPILTQLNDESFVDSIDAETEIVIRSNGSVFEKYNPNKKIWEPITDI